MGFYRQRKPSSRKSTFVVLGFKPQSKNPAGFNILFNIILVSKKVRIRKDIHIIRILSTIVRVLVDLHPLHMYKERRVEYVFRINAVMVVLFISCEDKSRFLKSIYESKRSKIHSINVTFRCNVSLF